jgi:hypothetical protein
MHDEASEKDQVNISCEGTKRLAHLTTQTLNANTLVIMTLTGALRQCHINTCSS